jgi:hypothetical protein
MMKVETDLKAGAFLENAASTVNQAASEVGGFFSKAGQQAQSMTHGVSSKTTSVWNCLTH